MTYIKTKTIRDTELSTLYEAQYAGTDTVSSDLKYFIKEYHTDFTDKYPNIANELLNNEYQTSQRIENTSKASIVIPVQEKNHNSLIMQFRENGLFLSEIIEILEEKYQDKIPLDIVLEITSEILTSLGKLHHFLHQDEEMGYVHLDLNPGNIFFESVDIASGKWGSVKFIDFESSVDRYKKEEELCKRSWSCVTNGFSAPEVVEDDKFHICISSDLYSIGSCMLRMFYGKTFREIDRRKIDLSRENRGDYKKILFDEIIINCSVEPSHYRYQTAEEMLKDIQTLKTGIENIDKGNYYAVLESAYEMCISSESVCCMIETPELEGMRNSIMKLEKSLRAHSNQILYPKCRFIFDGLLSLAEKQEKMSTKDWSSLFNSGLTCCNYAGDSRAAIKLYNKLFEISEENGLSINDYIMAQLGYAVSLLDLLKYQDAELVVCDLIEALEAFCHRKQLLPQSHNIELGCAYSSLATISVFKGQYDKVLPYYEKALIEFTGDSFDANITRSKILHFAVQTHNRELYQTYAGEYFGQEGNILETLKQIKESGPYALHIFLKGVYEFEMENVDDAFLHELSESIKYLWRKKIGHPTQLIYKYAALIFLQKGSNEKAENYYQRSLTCIPAGNMNQSADLTIFHLISYQTASVWNEKNGKEQENKNLKERLLALSVKENWQELEEKIKESEKLSTLLPHEYC